MVYPCFRISVKSTAPVDFHDMSGFRLKVKLGSLKGEFPHPPFRRAHAQRDATREQSDEIAASREGETFRVRAGHTRMSGTRCGRSPVDKASS